MCFLPPLKYAAYQFRMRAIGLRPARENEEKEVDRESSAGRKERGRETESRGPKKPHKQKDSTSMVFRNPPYRGPLDLYSGVLMLMCFSRPLRVRKREGEREGERERDNALGDRFPGLMLSRRPLSSLEQVTLRGQNAQRMV